ncbi:4Fe-4S dicluster domain-containing protein [Eggerthella sinensis]|uniref:4Fe-4S dicluster domain-containing protein n=1 Tax=Eggerthella sinensis TaxID=242230 RepID=UPI00266BC4BE|nr:4Fe-4S dicluster domain-containing protein [Eggerthella sinensis]
MSQYAFYFDGTRCTGCKTCEMSCKDYNDLNVGMTYRRVLEATMGDTTRDADGIVTTTCVSYPVSVACNHCDSPICFEKCPQSAIVKDADTGLMSIDEEKCIGCGTCAIVCPYSAPKVDEEKKKAVRCNGCADRVAAGEKPVCVEACPARALDFGTAEEMAKLGERANIAPLPDASETTPNLFIKASADAQPVGTVEVANPLEVA